MIYDRCLNGGLKLICLVNLYNFWIVLLLNDDINIRIKV